MQFNYQLPCFVLDITIVSAWSGDKISSLRFLLVSFSISVKILEFKIGHNHVVLYNTVFTTLITFFLIFGGRFSLPAQLKKNH